MDRQGWRPVNFSKTSKWEKKGKRKFRRKSGGSWIIVSQSPSSEWLDNTTLKHFPEECNVFEEEGTQCQTTYTQGQSLRPAAMQIIFYKCSAKSKNNTENTIKKKMPEPDSGNYFSYLADIFPISDWQEKLWPGLITIEPFVSEAWRKDLQRLRGRKHV